MVFYSSSSLLPPFSLILSLFLLIVVQANDIDSPPMIHQTDKLIYMNKMYMVFDPLVYMDAMPTSPSIIAFPVFSYKYVEHNF